PGRHQARRRAAHAAGPGQGAGVAAGLPLPTTFGPGVREGNRAKRIVEVGDDLSRSILPIVVSVDGVKQ
ncbi:hypothetical protein OMF39_19385, partial [Bordetella pertussis]